VLKELLNESPLVQTYKRNYCVADRGELASSSWRGVHLGYFSCLGWLEPLRPLPFDGYNDLADEIGTAGSGRFVVEIGGAAFLLPLEYAVGVASEMIDAPLAAISGSSLSFDVMQF
jgi:hypothetical protein